MVNDDQIHTVFMTGPDISVKGGMSTVVKQYLSSNHWKAVKLRHIPTYVEGSNLKKALYFAAQYARLLMAGIKEKPAAIHIHVSERGSVWRKSIVLLTFHKLGVKTVLHHHGAEFFDFYDNSSAVGKRMIQKAMGMADLNLVLSGYHCKMMQERFPAAKFKVLHNAIEPTDKSVYDTNVTGILFVGRLGQRKGTFDLVNALIALDDKLPAEIRYYFCGDGDTEIVAQMFRQKDMEHRIAHIGWCSKEQLEEFYRQAMLFILPSYHEGLPMSLLEAMYAGIPCIASNVDGIPEVIQSGYNGLLVESGNVEQIKHCLMTLVQSKEQRATLGQMGYVTIEQKFMLDKHIEDLENMYLEV